jgi:pullulanase/glycogen debranching enzyme
VELLLYEAKTAKGSNERIPFNEKTGDIQDAYLPDLLSGPLRPVDGPHNQAAGFRFNPYKALLDSCANAIGGTIDSSDTVFAHRVGDEETNL